MVKIILNDKYIDMLERILKSDCSDKLKLKAKVILLSQNKTIEQIINETKLSKRTIINYKNKWNENPFSFLHKNNYNRSKLYNYRNEIKQEFNKNIAQSYKEASERIKMMWNIQISSTQVRSFFNKNRLYTKNAILKSGDYLKKRRYNSSLQLSKVKVSEFQKHIAPTYKEAAKRIQKLWHVKWGLTKVRNFFIENNLYTQNTLKKKINEDTKN